MFKIESYFGPLLMSYLNKYVKLEEESFKLSLWGGDVTFHNLELQYDVLEDLMPLPIGLKSGQVHELKVHVPWTKLGSESVVITLNTVECIVALKSDFIHKSKSDNSTKDSSNVGPKQKLEKNIPPGYLKSYLVNIINNIHVKVNNLIIKFVEDDIVLSMNAKSLEYLTVTNDWSRGFTDFSTGNLLVNKIVQVSDLTVCLDQMDGNGHIELYQEPILYRCSVECRFILLYRSFTSSKPNFLKFNIKFNNLELNVTISQMPMIRRLTELFYALYYNTINWDAVVGCGFSNQISKVLEKSKELDKEIPLEVQSSKEEVEQTSWGSWAWSYVPSMFAYDESLIEEDNFESDNKQEINNKKILIFGLYFDSMQINLKKSQAIKSHYGTQRVSRSQRTILFMSLQGKNIGLNVTTNGIGFFNVQLGSTDIQLLNTGGICPCGQIYKVDDGNKISDCDMGTNALLHMGSVISDTQAVNDFYLTGSLFSSDCHDRDYVTNTFNKLNNICSQETYATLFSQEKCLDKFGALWFDYVYCMQIVNNDMDESHIDMTNLCNTDGIRESSTINVYVGQSIFNVNSYFVHNLIELTKALDISKYSSYFKSSNMDDRRTKVFYPTEDQVARIHEFIPIRHYNISLSQSTINIPTFLESHSITYQVPIIVLKARMIKFSKSTPMYPIHLIDCVSVLSTNLLKESKDLLNKCYVTKLFEVNGMSLTLLIQEIYNETPESISFMKSEIIHPCNMSIAHRTMLCSESWKTSQFINDEKTINISIIKSTMVPSHVKTVFAIVASNYSWIVNYFQVFKFSSHLTTMNRHLDDITLKLIDPHSSLIEACFKGNYQASTYELHIALPSAMIKSWKTQSSYYIDAKVSSDSLFAYLQEPLTSKIIPVLDNKVSDVTLPKSSSQVPFCVLYCQIPMQTRPVNCAFSFNCQVGPLHCMLSSHLINWFVFPELDFELDDGPTPQTLRATVKSREGTILSGSKMVSDTRSTADGNSRPESPTVLFNTFPVPGHPTFISNIESSLKPERNDFLSTKSGWWDMFKESCSKYFFFLQSLDVCIKMKKSNFYIVTVTDSSAFQFGVKSCSEWVDQFGHNNRSSIFVITMTRLALINSQRKEYLDDNFDRNSNLGLKLRQLKSTTFIESLPWELIFHDIQVDCVHPQFSISGQSQTSLDSILKPVSINCTLSATPKCSSPERLESLYSISWGVHVDITEVQPTLKQIYLISLLEFFVNVFLKLSCPEFRRKHYQLLTSHYCIVRYNNSKAATEETPIFKSKHSISTKSTLKSESRSSTTERRTKSSSYRITCSKSENLPLSDKDTGFKLSFWIQCTLSQFQFVVLLDDDTGSAAEGSEDQHRCLVMQIDDVTGSVDVQEKFVEIKAKFGSIFCQLGLMRNDEIISETPILKSGSKFLPNACSSSKLKKDRADDVIMDSSTRHCLSAAIIRTTDNNLSQRPLSTYHQIHDTDSFKSYPTEFTGNFSTAPDPTNSHHNFVTQISSIVEPFELIVSPYAIEQCHKLTDTLISIYLRFFRYVNLKYGSSKKVNVSTIKLEPYFISEDIPKFHLLVKSSKIIMPCQTIKSDVVLHRQDGDSACIILSWNKISLQPFSDNPISRPKAKVDGKEDDSLETKCESSVTSMESEHKSATSLDDNRQFQLDVTNFGIYSSIYSVNTGEQVHSTSNYDVTLPKISRQTDNFSTSIIHGQNPAFEWNNYSKMSVAFHSRKSSDSNLKPILKPIDIQVNFAGALYQNSDDILQRCLVGGYGLEINILTSVEFLLDTVSIESVKSVSENLNKLFSRETITIIETDQSNRRIHSLDDFIIESGLENAVPCVPTNILVTTRKIQFLFMFQNQSSINGLCLSISQPHLLLYFLNRQSNKLEVSLFDVTLMVTPTVWSESLKFFDNRDEQINWTLNQNFILAEMRTILKTKSGCPDMKTGVPKSFFVATFNDFYQTNVSKLKLEFCRQTMLELNVDDVEQIVNVIHHLIPQTVPVKQETKPTTFSSSILIPRYFTLSTAFVSLKLNSEFEIQIGTIDIESCTLKNYILNNLRSSIEFCCTSLLMTNHRSDGQVAVILRPMKVSGKCQYRKYRPDSADKIWTSSELFGDIDIGSVYLSIGRQQIIAIQRLIQTIKVSIRPILKFDSSTVDQSKSNNYAEMFYDDLRSEQFQIHTKINTDNVPMCESLHMIAEDATVTFSDDGEDLAAMYWTYPESRFITCIEVMPVPFVFIEYKLDKDDNYEQLQIPCQLEYWSSSNNCYESYKKFHLSENQVERVDDFPSLDDIGQSESAGIIVSKSWRVVFDCYARYKKVDNEKNISYSERAMLVYLSPLVLAASMKVDSCYAPSTVRNSFILLSTPLIQIEYRDMDQSRLINGDDCRPFKATSEDYEDCSIVDMEMLCSIICEHCSLKYQLTGDVHSHISNVALHIVDPFVALKCAVVSVDEIDLALEMVPHQNIRVDVGVIQAGVDEFQLRQLVMICDDIQQLVTTISSNRDHSPLARKSYQLWFCNFLDRKIRVRQHQNSFYYCPESAKVGGICSGEGVLLKFLPLNYGKYNTSDNTTDRFEPIKLSLGLCSELKGTVRWTESIELPSLNYDQLANLKSNLVTWNIDNGHLVDAPICSNCSSLSNSYNARHLLLLHSQSITGLNKLILMGNTMFNNLTTDAIHVNFSLPTEISSGFSFDVWPSVSGDIVTSMHINWKSISLAGCNNIFELSFRSGTGSVDNVEYRSHAYKITVPKFEDQVTKYHYDHSIIKMKEYKSESQVIMSSNHWRQILCTLEWFRLNKNDDIFLLMTFSPMVICSNMMLHDVRMQLTWISEASDPLPHIKETILVEGKGGLLNVTKFFGSKSVEVNASFLNDPKLLFEKPLVLTDLGLLDSLDKTFRQQFSSSYLTLDYDTIRQQLSSRLVKIIDHDSPDLSNQLSENPYSVLITITPWILVTNRTAMDLVLGLDRNIYLLEALNDFVPPQYNKPVKIGITYDNEIFWSKSFVIGDSILSQNESAGSADLSWTIVDTDDGHESYLQIDIVLSQERIMVPITLRHLFSRQSPKSVTNRSRVTCRHNTMFIESSVYVSNQTSFDLSVLPMSLSSLAAVDHVDSSRNLINVCPGGRYLSVDRFVRFGDADDAKWFLSLAKKGSWTDITSFSNIVSILDFRKLSNFREIDNITYTSFCFIEQFNEVSQETNFDAFLLNSTLDYRTHKIHTDIFETEIVPITITNNTSFPLIFNQYEDNVQDHNGSIIVLQSRQSVPIWPNSFVLDFNKDGCANFDNVQLRLRLGIAKENDTDWTDYFPLSVSHDPTSLDIVTMKGRQHLFIVTQSSTTSKLVIHIHEQNASTVNNTLSIPLPTFNTTVSIAKCLLSVFERSVNLECPDEMIRLIADNSRFIYSYNHSSVTTRYEISIGDIQLDNKRYSSGMYDFPVVVYSRNSSPESKFFICLLEKDSCGMLSIDLNFKQEIEVFVENILLYDLLRVFTQLSHCIVPNRDSGFVQSTSSSPLNLGTVHISTIPLLITIHAFLKIYVSCEATSLSLPKFFCQSSLIRLKTVQRKLYEHYVTAALVRCGWVMGSFELLGNPSGIVHHLNMALSNLICSKNIDHGLLADFLLRILTFCRYTTGGLVSSFTGIASSVSRNLDYLCLDNTHITRQDTFRRQNQPGGVMHGFVQGLSGFALSLLGAIAGLADHPLHDSQEAMNNHSSVTLALLKGLGKGLVGVITKPLSGTAELFALTGRGLLRTTGITIVRCHSPCGRLESKYRPEIVVDERRVLAHLLATRSGEDSVCSRDSLRCVWSGLGTNYGGQLIYLFLTHDSLIEWIVDNPLSRSKSSVYRLIEYDIITSQVRADHFSITLHQSHKRSRQPVNADLRISAFLSEQHGAVVTVDQSHSSSLDSTEFITLTDPRCDRNGQSTEDNNTSNNVTETGSTIFTVSHTRDRLLSALTFLQLYRDCSDVNDIL